MPAPIDERIVDALQAGLALHLSQADAYEAQAAHFQRWGYPGLASRWSDYAADERHHEALCLQRLEFFDVAPDMSHDAIEWPRHDFLGILDQNYATDSTAAETERAGYLAANEVGDVDTAKIFAELLHGSEAGMAEIEAIRSVISQIGLDNYLAGQMTAGS